MIKKLHLFTFKHVREEEFRDTIKNLRSKPSTGVDGISTILLKHLGPLLTKSICLIINQSLTTGIFPDKLKIAKIIPIHKKDDIHLIKTYRPISILPSISKIFEKIVYNQLYSYLNTNQYLYTGQYGFRKSHLTDMAALELVDRILSDLDQGHTPVTIYLDLSKAF